MQSPSINVENKQQKVLAEFSKVYKPGKIILGNTKNSEKLVLFALQSPKTTISFANTCTDGMCLCLQLTHKLSCTTNNNFRYRPIVCPMHMHLAYNFSSFV